MSRENLRFVRISVNVSVWTGTAISEPFVGALGNHGAELFGYHTCNTVQDSPIVKAQGTFVHILLS